MYKIMVVDDEDDALGYIRQLIDTVDFEVQIVGEAHNGAEGLRVFQEKQPDIVLTDVVMPGMTGLEMVDQIIKMGSDCFFIILTAYNDFNYAKQAIDLEVKSYILKHELDEIILLKTLQHIKEHLDRRAVSRLRQKWSEYQDALDNHFTFLPAYMSEYVPESEAVLLQVRVYKKELLAEQRDKLVLAILKENEKPVRHFYVLHCVDDRLTAVLYLPPLAKGKSYRYRYILEQQDRLKELIGSPIATGVSLPFPCWTGLKTAVEQASQALINQFFQRNESIFFYLGRMDIPDRAVERAELLAQLEEKLSRKEADFEPVLDQLLELHCQLCSYEQYQEDIDKILMMIGKHLRENAILLSRSVAECRSVEEVFSVLKETISSLSLPQGSPKMKQILRYIHLNYNQQISLEELSDAFYISKIYICQLFKQEIGMSFKTYLNQIRMEKADELLSSGEYKVYEVADLVGYQSSTYFSNAYKKYKGHAPKTTK